MHVTEDLKFWELEYPPLWPFKLFEPVKKLIDFKVRSDNVEFNCETSLRPVVVRLDFCAADIIRVRMGHAGIPEGKTPMLVKDKLTETNIQVEESQNSVIVSTESLLVRINKNPWQLRFFDVSGRLVTEESISDLNVIGESVSPSLGFIQASKESFVAESMRLFPDEHIYGLGEKFADLDRRGKVFCSWNQDGLGNTTPRTYKNIPFFMSTRGYGVFINSSSKIIYDFGYRSHVCYTFMVEDEQLDYFLIYGPSFKKILNLYTELTGKAPVPPKWSFGLWMSRCSYRNSREIEDVARELRERDIPCDVIHLDPAWLREGQECDLVWNREAFPDPEGMISRLKKMGFKLSLWINPYVPKGSELFEEAKKRGFLVKKDDGSVYDKPLEPWGHHIFVDRGVVDFSNPHAAEWYKKKLKRFLEMGVAVFKTDFGESAPIDGVYWGGVKGGKIHNVYSLLYNKAVFEVTKEVHGEGIVWARSGYAGMQRYPTCWSGDAQPRYSTMACTLRGGLSLGLSGVPFWSHDIGGFNGTPTPELYVRWAQFGLFCSHSRCHGTTPREPWKFGAEALRIFREYVKLRYRLLPYIYSCAHISSKTGLPLIRAMVLEYQDDPNCYDKDTQYMFGECFLVAPILEEGDERNVYLPAGRWIDYWTKEEYEGPKNITYHAPLERLPLFVKADSIIPMGPEMSYVGEKPLDPITLDIYLYTHAEFTMYDDDGKTVKFRGDKNPQKISFEIIGGAGNYVLRFNNTAHPSRVIFNGKEVARCSTYEEFERRGEGWWSDPSGTVIVKISCRERALIIIEL